MPEHRRGTVSGPEARFRERGYPGPMSRLILVDAYNAAWRLFGDVGGDLDQARRRLVERAQEAIRHRRLRGGIGRVHLVFDTYPGAEREGLRSRAGRVSWHYAKGSADDAIVEHMRLHEGRPGGPGVVVVTNDRELAGRTRQLGARILGVDEFFGRAGARPAGEDRIRPPIGPPLGANDFDLPEGEIDLDDPDLL